MTGNSLGVRAMSRIYSNAAVIEWHYIDASGTPKAEGNYLVASTMNQHRVFSAKYSPSKGWHLKDKGRHIYAWAENPDFPPLAPQI